MARTWTAQAASRRASVLCGSLVVVVGLAGAGCDDMPDSASASQAFRDHRADVDAIETAVRAALPAVLPPLECADPAVVATSGDAAAAAEFERCHTAQAAQREAAILALRRLTQDTLPSLLDARPAVLGVEVTEGSATRSAGSLGPSNPGTDAASGVSIDEHQVGWHLYQTAFSFTPPGQGVPVSVGDGEARPAIEVLWTVTEGQRSARVRAVILIDAQTDDAWQAAQRRAASGT